MGTGITKDDIKHFSPDIQKQIYAQIGGGDAQSGNVTAGQVPQKPIRRQKYTAQKVGKYDSKSERARHIQLQAMEQVGEICNLIYHPMRLYLGETDLGNDSSYRPDFYYYDKVKEVHVIEEVKGVRVRDWPVRSALVKNMWGHLFELRVTKG